MTRYRHKKKAFIVADITAWILMVYAILVILVFCLQSFDSSGTPFAVPVLDILCAVLFGLAAFFLYRRSAGIGLVLLIVAFTYCTVFFSSFPSKVFFSISSFILVIPWLLQRLDPNSGPSD